MYNFVVIYIIFLGGLDTYKIYISHYTNILNPDVMHGNRIEAKSTLSGKRWHNSLENVYRKQNNLAHNVVSNLQSPLFLKSTLDIEIIFLCVHVMQTNKRNISNFINFPVVSVT